MSWEPGRVKSYICINWGGRDRTSVNGVKVHRPTAERHPKQIILSIIITETEVTRISYSVMAYIVYIITWAGRLTKTEPWREIRDCSR